MTLKTLLARTMTSCAKIAPGLALAAAAAFAQPVEAQNTLFDTPAKPRASTVRFKDANVVRPATNKMTLERNSSFALFEQQPNVKGRATQVAYQAPLAKPAAPSQNVTVKAYYVRPQELNLLSKQLKADFGLSNDVAVAAYESKSQVLVMAPAATHNAIAQKMATRGYKPSDPFEPNPLNADNIPNRQYKLQHLNWTDIESMVTKIWKGKSTVVTAADGRTSTLTWPLSQAKQVAVTVDRATNTLLYRGGQAELAEWHKAVRVLDVDKKTVLANTQVIKVNEAKSSSIKQAVSILTVMGNQEKPAKLQDIKPRWGGDVAASVFQPVQQTAAQQEGAPQEGGNTEQGGLPGYSSSARIEILDDGTVIITGTPADREKFKKDLENLSKNLSLSKPKSEIQKLEHRDSAEIIQIVQRIYDNQFQQQYGPVDLSSLGQKNSVFIVGSEETVKAVKDLIVALDQPVADEDATFRIFPLKFISAIDAQTRLNELTGVITQGTQNNADQVDTTPILKIVPDYRSNILIINANPQQMSQIEKMIDAIDVDESMAKDVIKVFPLRNALATDLAPILQDALNGQLQQSGRSNVLQTQGGGFGQQNIQGGNNAGATIRSHSVSLKMLDAKGKEMSAIMFDVRINADTNSNQLIVTGPEKSMPLIEELVKQLDKLPNAESQVKVFTIVNGDATTLAATLTTLFSSQQQQTGGGGFGGNNQSLGQLPLVTGDGTTSLVGLQISTDVRTNSIIVAGSEADLNVVDALLARLDQDEISNRVYKVFRLQHVLAATVADELNGWLEGAQVFNTDQTNGAGTSAYTQVIVQAEAESNSLIIAATPQYYELIAGIIKDIDHRRQVVVQALIAEVTLGDTEEFGFEWGLQDSLLFDRGLNASNLADGTPIGFPFNQVGIGNSLDAVGLAGRETLAGQALSNLSVGRTNDSLGYGGLVLSAGNESVTMLMRALKDRSQAKVLSRPQIRTLENLQGFTSVGQQIPLLDTSQVNNAGIQTFGVRYQDVGIQLSVTPRVGDDGTIYMEVDVINSSLNPGPGIAIQSGPDGSVIEQPIINNTSAQTTISARNGQTVVIGGLINTSVSDTTRGVPFISDIPLLGRLFRFDSTTESRSELLILLRPIIVEDEETDALVNQLEYDRMNWCLKDVHAVHGPLDSSPVPDTTFNAGQFMNTAPVQPHDHMSAPQGTPQPLNVMPAEAAPALPDQSNVQGSSNELPTVDPTLGSNNTKRNNLLGLPVGGLDERSIPGATAERRIFQNPFKKRKKVSQASYQK